MSEPDDLGLFHDRPHISSGRLISATQITVINRRPLPVSDVTPWLDAVMPDVRRSSAKYHGGKQKVIPRAIGFHCTASDGNADSYIPNPQDGRMVSYNAGIIPDLSIVQWLPLDYRAYHAGKPLKGWWGNDALGLVLPGPETRKRTDGELEVFTRLVDGVMVCLGGYPDTWFRHSDTPLKDRRDPGPGFDDRFENVLDSFGLKWGLPD